MCERKSDQQIQELVKAAVVRVEDVWGMCEDVDVGRRRRRGDER